LLGTIIGLIIIGVVGGFVARAVVRGANAMDTSEKIVVSVAGSLAGGLVGHIVLHEGTSSLTKPHQERTRAWRAALCGGESLERVGSHIPSRAICA
jgi:uncharacterized membrane protein YeaQ/YmgE (transglycosylase-associated protein family)